MVDNKEKVTRGAEFRTRQKEKSIWPRKIRLKLRLGKEYFKNPTKAFLSLPGFSLIEVMTAIAVIAILSSILLPYYNQVRRQYALLRSTYRLAQDLRKTQEMATSAKEFYLVAEDKDIVPLGYGLYLRTNDDFYQLYADLNGNQEYDASDQILETVQLEANVKFLSISPDDNNLSVNFKGPAPITRLKNISAEIPSAAIVLGLTNNESINQQVIVNRAGLIYVE